MEAIYTAQATVTGGRNGHVKSSNGVLDADIKMPKELGGPAEENLNPEILFAAGYAACFDSALNLVIKNAKVKTGETSVTADVSLGKIGEGFGLGVKLEINIPEVDQATAEELAQKAHEVCPYSNATRNNIEVELEVTTK
ncbi:organic hydroperoxide resistance protein [Fulvivirga maritima]|uniref:organic hydroperoxide resistance protein n=1 Tax=Fulvivirga maritima TaxID=2904247 RepID=UPI001F31D36C|nr:organic hydroperoxide resistance protein [Fulvivirga maritima]UII25047.1 organic hydroperoxide resistance protein [Fulvivirga maritima]